MINCILKILLTIKSFLLTFCRLVLKASFSLSLYFESYCGSRTRLWRVVALSGEGSGLPPPGDNLKFWSAAIVSTFVLGAVCFGVWYYFFKGNGQGGSSAGTATKPGEITSSPVSSVSDKAPEKVVTNNNAKVLGAELTEQTNFASSELAKFKTPVAVKSRRAEFSTKVAKPRAPKLEASDAEMISRLEAEIFSRSTTSDLALLLRDPFYIDLGRFTDLLFKELNRLALLLEEGARADVFERINWIALADSRDGLRSIRADLLLMHHGILRDDPYIPVEYEPLLVGSTAIDPGDDRYRSLVMEHIEMAQQEGHVVGAKGGANSLNVPSVSAKMLEDAVDPEVYKELLVKLFEEVQAVALGNRRTPSERHDRFMLEYMLPFVKTFAKKRLRISKEEGLISLPRAISQYGPPEGKPNRMSFLADKSEGYWDDLYFRVERAQKYSKIFDTESKFRDLRMLTINDLQRLEELEKSQSGRSASNSIKVQLMIELKQFEHDATTRIACRSWLAAMNSRVEGETGKLDSALRAKQESIARIAKKVAADSDLTGAPSSEVLLEVADKVSKFRLNSVNEPELLELFRGLGSMIQSIAKELL